MEYFVTQLSSRSSLKSLKSLRDSLNPQSPSRSLKRCLNVRPTRRPTASTFFECYNGYFAAPSIDEMEGASFQIDPKVEGPTDGFSHSLGSMRIC